MKHLLFRQIAISVTMLVVSGNLLSCKKSGKEPSLFVGAVSTDTAWVGKPVTIQGSGFSSTATDNIIRIGDIVATEVVEVSPSTLTFKVPPGAVSGKLYVRVNGKEQSASRELVIVNQLAWQKALGGIIDDYGIAVAASADGGYLVAGYTQSGDGDVAIQHGGYDYWILKLNADRTIAWQKTFGGSRDDYATGIVALADGGCVVAGYTSSTDDDISGNHGASDYCIVKLDANGNIVWKTVLGGSGADEANGIIATSTGYVISGYTSSTDGDITNNHGLSDYWVVWLDASGALVKQKTYGGTGYDNGEALAIAGDGYLVAGSSSSTDGDATGNHGNTDFWIVKLNTTGNIMWQTSLGGTARETASCIVSTADGGSLVAGYTTSNDGDVTGYHGGYDYWVIKLLANGSVAWKKTLGGSLADQPAAITPAGDGGCIVAGMTTSNNGDVSGLHGTNDSWIVRLNATGNMVWQKTSGGTQSDATYGLAATGNSFIAVGYSNSTNGDVSGLHGTSRPDFWLFKILD